MRSNIHMMDEYVISNKSTRMPEICIQDKTVINTLIFVKITTQLLPKIFSFISTTVTLNIVGHKYLICQTRK